MPSAAEPQDPKVRMSVTVPVGLWRRLRDATESTGRSRNGLVNDAVVAYLEVVDDRDEEAGDGHQRPTIHHLSDTLRDAEDAPLAGAPMTDRLVKERDDDG